MSRTMLVGVMLILAPAPAQQSPLRVLHVTPASAILPTERGFVAFVVQDKKAVQRSVRPGLFVREGVVEVLEGLTAGETLVVTGTAAIFDGASLIVKELP